MMFGGMMILVWLVPIVGGYFLVKYLMDQNRNNSSVDETDPLVVLKRRYANGEINQQEFQERKRTILDA